MKAALALLALLGSPHVASGDWLVLADGARSEVERVEVLDRSVRVTTLAGKTWILIKEAVDLNATREANQPPSMEGEIAPEPAPAPPEVQPGPQPPEAQPAPQPPTAPRPATPPTPEAQPEPQPPEAQPAPQPPTAPRPATPPTPEAQPAPQPAEAQPRPEQPEAQPRPQPPTTPRPATPPPAEPQPGPQPPEAQPRPQPPTAPRPATPPPTPEAQPEPQPPPATRPPTPQPPETQPEPQPPTAPRPATPPPAEAPAPLPRATTPPLRRSSEVEVTILDQTGGLIPDAYVVLQGADGERHVADMTGRTYRARVAPGPYTLVVAANGFAPFSEDLELAGDSRRELTVTLTVHVRERVDVTSESGLSIAPGNSLITLSGEELKGLPSNPRDLVNQLLHMAGSPAQPEEVVIYVNGFREKRNIPPLEAIDVIRISVDPFSAEFPEPGSRRIEITTKPGEQDFHGQFGMDFTDESLNSRNAFADEEIPFQSRTYRGYASVPLVTGRWDLLVYAGRWEQDETAVINAAVLNADLEPERFQESVLAPDRNSSLTLKTDYNITNRIKLGLEYLYAEQGAENQGLRSGFDLPDRAFVRTDREDVVRAGLSATIGSNILLDTRLQLRRRKESRQATMTEPAILVFDAFNDGGNQANLLNEKSTEEIELMERLTFAAGQHLLRVGFTADGAGLHHVNMADFGGTFVFGADVERDADGTPVISQGGQPISIPPLENYRRTVLRLPGYGPSQFSITRGDPVAKLNQWEFGFFGHDDWRVSPQLTLSFGARYEFQTNLDDSLNIAPRFGLAWAVDTRRLNVIRLASGLFYQRLGTEVTLDTIRLDGEHQQRFIVQRPLSFPQIPDSLDGALRPQQTIYTKDPEMKAPYLFISSASYERRLTSRLFGSATYTFERGRRLFRSRNINAPMPGRVVEAQQQQSGPNIQFESTGRSTRHELMLSFRGNLTTSSWITANYRAAWLRDDTSGPYSLPASSFDLESEFGNGSLDHRHQVTVTGSMTLPWRIKFSPSFSVTSAQPFNIITGMDNNRDSLFTDRPALADPADPNGIRTAFGSFNPNPGPGAEVIERNFARQSRHITLNLMLSKTFVVGAGSYVALGVNARNLLNRTNLGDFNGVVTSPLFGQANWALPARSVSLGLQFGY